MNGNLGIGQGLPSKWLTPPYFSQMSEPRLIERNQMGKVNWFVGESNREQVDSIQVRNMDPFSGHYGQN